MLSEVSHKTEILHGFILRSLSNQTHRNRKNTGSGQGLGIGVTGSCCSVLQDKKVLNILHNHVTFCTVYLKILRWQISCYVFFNIHIHTNIYSHKAQQASGKATQNN
jgi:hypothetical protein